jgi:hypothetical protein
LSCFLQIIPCSQELKVKGDITLDRTSVHYTLNREKRILNTLTALYRDRSLIQETLCLDLQKTRHTLLPRPQKHCLSMRGCCPPAGMRRVTLSYFIAGPLGGISVDL